MTKTPPDEHKRQTLYVRRRYAPGEYRQRPRDYDPVLARDIVERVRDNELLVEICDDRDMPTPGTFLLWCEQETSLAESYEQALRIAADVAADEQLQEAFNPDDKQGRVRSEAMRWRAQSLLPDKYGPRATLRMPKDVPDDPRGGGVDYSSEIRRKLEAIHQRQQEQSDGDGAGTAT